MRSKCFRPWLAHHALKGMRDYQMGRRRKGGVIEKESRRDSVSEEKKLGEEMELEGEKASKRKGRREERKEDNIDNHCM